MIRLTNTTQKLLAVLAGTVATNQLSVNVSYSDKTSTTYDGGVQNTVTNSTTPADICAAPAASTIRDIDYISVYNADTVSATVSIIFDDNGTDYTLIKQALQPSEQMTYVHGGGWEVTGVSLPVSNYVAKSSSVGSALVPSGTEAQRDGTPAAGYFRFNSDVAKFEGYNGTAWGSVGGGATGGGGDEVFIENDQTVTVNYTIPTGRNAMTTGPITINSGVTVTVSAGSTWVVL